MAYTIEYVKDVEDIFKKLNPEKGKDSSLLAPFSVKVGMGEGNEEFNVPPVIEIVRAIGEGDISLSTAERLARFCILNKQVTITYDGVTVGTTFILNGMDDMWDTVPTFKECPLALSYLFEMCTAFVLKKSLPPQKKPSPDAAAAATVGQVPVK